MKKASDLNYLITSLEMHKLKQLCHINMLIEYVDRDISNVYVDRDSSNVTSINVISRVSQKQIKINCVDIDCEEMNLKESDPTCSIL